MNSAGGLFSYSFSVGTWFATNLRISILTPLLAVLLTYQLGMEAGLIATVLVLLSLLGHEFAHIFSARATGGYGDEILISPFGGLAMVQPGGTFLSRLIVPASGPILNLAVCAGLVPILLGQDQSVRTLMNPMNYGEDGSLVLATQTSHLACQLGFIVNWLLVLINLIPVHPLDGGRVLQTVLTEQYGLQASNHIYLKVGTFAGIAFVFGGLLFNSAFVVAIGTFVLVMNLEETYRMRSADAYDDSFMGYDFSQGYTSLERGGADEPAGERKTKAGFFAKWRQERKDKREAAERERAAADAKQLDDILARLHDVGYDSLTDEEKRVLNRASNRYKNRQDGAS
jgi:Zn-dependent protease